MRSRVHETGPPRAAVSVVVGVGVIQNLRRAHEAYERREWVSVHQALSGLSDIELEPDDFVTLATAAFLLGAPTTWCRPCRIVSMIFAASGAKD